jgi:hypothetical protein
MRLPTVAAGLAAVLGLALVPAPAPGGPAFQAVRDAAARARSLNNLKQLALAVHNYYDVFGHFPQDVRDKDGNPLLSWRVHLLPYLEQGQLYAKFKMDESWDGPNNKKVSREVVKVFQSPNAPPVQAGPDAPGLTHYLGFAGPGAVFDPGKRVKITDILDGTSNTLLMVETAAVPWAAPGDVPFDPEKPLPKLGLPGADVLLVGLCDGSTRVVDPKKVGEKTLKAAVTRNGGEVLGKDWDR